MKARPARVSGILLLDKPAGMTSTAALSRAKRCLDERKAGHTGALDPMATGLLPLCFGEATKISAFLLDSDKAYEAELLLGMTTYSGDADGEVTSTSAVPMITAEELEPVLERFRGPILQVPPMVSALKHQGRRLHELARAGIEIERPPRPVRIDRLDLIGLDLPRIRIRVDCSKGTYIRSLAMDIGATLGCGAHLTALRRLRSGPFDLDDAITLNDLQEMSVEQARNRLLTPDSALPDWPAVQLDAAQAEAVSHGRAFRLDMPAAAGVRMYRESRFLGLGQVEDDGTLKVRRLLHLPAER